MFDKEAKNIHWIKTCSSINGAGKTGLSTCNPLELDPYLFSCTKIKFKWITYLNIEPETLKLLQKKLEKTL
jgi:hypothetical protein